MSIGSDDDDERDDSGAETQYKPESESSDESGHDECIEPPATKKNQRCMYTKQEEYLLFSEFKDNIRNGIIPSNNDARCILKKYTCFQRRNIHQIKSKIQHMIKLKKM